MKEVNFEDLLRRLESGLAEDERVARAALAKFDPLDGEDGRGGWQVQTGMPTARATGDISGLMNGPTTSTATVLDAR